VLEAPRAAGGGQRLSVAGADATAAAQAELLATANELYQRRALGRRVARRDMSLPVDPSFFADAAFTAALEQQGGEESRIIGVGVGVAEVTKGEGDSEERSGFHSIVSAGEEGERSERMPTEQCKRGWTVFRYKVVNILHPEGTTASAGAGSKQGWCQYACYVRELGRKGGVERDWEYLRRRSEAETYARR